ncbi:Reticulon-domain-containing protein [Phyllosticta citrichinensis]|uniref:Reticulon-like protein n=1 Tax=Phyllosticta citrichinensis TaxID=1130410 RepID=A0ABR1XME2_9PEZI
MSVDEQPPQIPTPADIVDSHNVDLDPSHFQQFQQPIQSNGNEANANANANGSSAVQNAKSSAVSTAQSAMDTVQNHPLTQQAINGPVAQNIKSEAAKTQSEFGDLANSRRTPEAPAATGQHLTHYHSMFYRLLSWKNPRATGISFGLSVLFIFAARYLNIVRYIFKLLWVILGTTAIAEVAGKSVLGNGLASQMRPRKYYMIRKDSLERFTDDLEQLINFFIIEFQRIVFAENIYVTVSACVASFISYWLIKWLPLWGLGLIATTAVYLGPLVYLQNKEYIDEQLRQTNDLLNEQTKQLKVLANQHATTAQKQFKSYAQEYSVKAQEMIGQAKNRAVSATSRGQSTKPGMEQTKAPAAMEKPVEAEPVKEPEFPVAPTEEPKVADPVPAFEGAVAEPNPAI